MPALRGSDVPGRTWQGAQRTDPRADELVVVCARDDCDWQALRPLHAAWSAADAHRIAHERGLA